MIILCECATSTEAWLVLVKKNFLNFFFLLCLLIVLFDNIVNSGLSFLLILLLLHFLFLLKEHNNAIHTIFLRSIVTCTTHLISNLKYIFHIHILQCFLLNLYVFDTFLLDNFLHWLIQASLNIQLQVYYVFDLLLPTLMDNVRVYGQE